MAGLASIRKNFRFKLEIEGANSFEIQKVTPPTVEVTEVQHGNAGNLPNGKTAGKMVVGDLVVEKLIRGEAGANWAWDQMAKAIGSASSVYLGTGFLTDTGADMVSTVERHFLGDIWVKKIEKSEYDTNSDNAANLIETVTFSVQYYFPTSSPEFNALFGGNQAGALGSALALGTP